MKNAIVLVLVLLLSGGLLFAGASTRSDDTGTSYVLFDEMMANCPKEDGLPGFQTICTLSLFSNCDWNKKCR